MSKISITSGKILSDNTIIEVEYTEDREKGRPAELGGTYKDPPKDSLIDAFAKLNAHAAKICEFITSDDEDEVVAKKLLDFHASGFSLSDSKRNGAGVIITCQKTISSGKVFGFNTTTNYFNDTSENAYAGLSQLRRDIEHLKEELVNYIGGDHAPDIQGTLDLPGMEEEKPKRGRKKKEAEAA